MLKQTHIVLLFLLLSLASLHAQQLSLDSCLKLAEERNPQIRAKHLEVEKAKEVKKGAFTKYFPQVQATGFAFHSLYPMFDIGIDDIKNDNLRNALNNIYSLIGADAGLSRNITYLNYGAVATVAAVQPVFLGGRIVNGNRLAALGVEAATLQQDITDRQVLQDVEEAYWLIVSLKEKLSIIDSVYQLLDTLAGNVDIALQAGLCLSSDQLKLRIRRQEIDDQRLQLINGISLAREALAVAIGVDSMDVISYDPDYTYDIDEHQVGKAEKELLQLQVDAAKIERKIEIGKSLPQVGFSAAYSYNNLLEKNAHNGTLLLTVAVPLTQWWETSHKIKEKKIQEQQALLDQTYLSKQLELSRKQLLQDIEQSRLRLDNAATTLEAAKQNMQTTQANYDAGLATMSELLQAQTVLLKTHTDLTDLKIAYRIALMRYKRK